MTDADLFGSKRTVFTTELQREQFANAKWWQWGMTVLMPIVSMMDLPKSFRPVRLLLGGFGEVDIHSIGNFDVNLERTTLSKAVRHIKPELDRAMQSCIKGLNRREEPYAKVTKN